MEKIIGNELGTRECDNLKNYLYFLKSVLNTVGIKRLRENVLIKNHRFINVISLVNEKIKYVSTDLEGSGYKFKNMFLIEDEDYIKYLKLNISKIKSGELLIGFLYEGMTIKSIVFGEQIVEDNIIKDNLDYYLEKLNGVVLDGVDGKDI